MIQEKQTKENPNELILQHFILGTIIFLEALIKLLNTIIPSPNMVRKPIYKQLQEEKNSNPDAINLDTSWFFKKSNKELKSILKDVDILSNLTKSQFKDLILSNSKALEMLRVQYRRESLNKMTNLEIKSLLQGVEGISRLRKSQLIEMVLVQEKLSKAIKLSELGTLINSLDKGVASKTGDAGKLLSGGQAQRISIARALYRDPEILILDEATNSLDSDNEDKIINTLKNNLKHLTIIIISHRESSIKRCSQTFKIENKKILEINQTSI